MALDEKTPVVRLAKLNVRVSHAFCTVVTVSAAILTPGSIAFSSLRVILVPIAAPVNTRRVTILLVVKPTVSIDSAE